MADAPSTPPGTAYTAWAHPNIALVKYWGKRPGPGNLPAVGSLSITLDTLVTETRVALAEDLAEDALHLDGVPAPPEQARRATAFLDRVRALAGDPRAPRARVHSVNNFPTGAGLASSASGFAALAVAACGAYGVALEAKALSALAREGSGSAARSIFGGFAAMARGARPDGRDAVAEPLLEAAAWPLRVVVAVTSRAAKAVGSTEGMRRTQETSPYWAAWLAHQEEDLARARAAVGARDFARLAQVAEHSAFKMHALALSAEPALLYFEPTTLAVLQVVAALKRDRVPVFCTMDAGPQVKAVCLPEAQDRVVAALQAVPGVLQVMNVGLGPGAHGSPS